MARPFDIVQAILKKLRFETEYFLKSHARLENVHWNSMRLFKSEAYLLLPILILSFSKDKQETRTILPSESPASTCFYICLFYGVSKVPPLLPLPRFTAIVSIFLFHENFTYHPVFNKVVFNLSFLIIILILILYKCIMGFWIFKVGNQ